MFWTREDPLRHRELVTRSIQLRAETIDENQRSVEAVLATEAPTMVFDLETFRVIEEVLVARGAEFAEQVVMLESHMRCTLDAVLGSIRDLRIEGDHVVGRLVFAAGDERAERAWQKVRQGHITDVSVGYRALESVDIQPKSSLTLGGKQYTAGERVRRVTTRWRVREGSLVPIGADEWAKIREESGRMPGKEKTMNERLRAYLESIGLKKEVTEESARAFLDLLEGDQRARADQLAMTPEAAPPVASLRAAPQSGGTAPPSAAGPATTATVLSPAVEVDRLRAEGQAAERTRLTEIQRLGGIGDVPAELVTRAINEGWDVGRASQAFLSHLRDVRRPAVGAGTSVAVHVRDEAEQRNVRTLGMALAIRSGLPICARTASPSERAEAERAADVAHRFRDLSLVDVCREAIRLDGRNVPQGRMDMIREAVSGGSLAGIFTAAVNLQLMQSYQEWPDSTVGWVRESDVPDFKTNTRTLLGKGGGLKRLPRGGKADHTSIGDVSETYAIARFADQFVVDDQDIIDDRLNALLDMPMQMGAEARRLRPDLVYSILLANAALGADSVALFHATHANLGTGGGSALAAGSLEAGIAAMGSQTQNGKVLNVQARFLIVPQALKFTALVLLRSAQRIIASASGGTYNPLLDEDIQLRVDNKIGATGVTDPVTGTAYTGTATNWFLAASPTIAPTVEVGYLVGTGRAPMLRSFVLDKGQWGIGWDIKMDIGAKALDYRGLYKANGA